MSRSGSVGSTRSGGDSGEGTARETAPRRGTVRARSLAACSRVARRRSRIARYLRRRRLTQPPRWLGSVTLAGAVGESATGSVIDSAKTGRLEPRLSRAAHREGRVSLPNPPLAWLARLSLPARPEARAAAGSRARLRRWRCRAARTTLHAWAAAA